MDVAPATAGQVAPYYSPPQDTPVDDPSRPASTRGDAPFVGDTLDPASEQHIIDVPVDRGIRCHVGCDIVLDADGNLYLSTGDDTNPFQSDGYTPIDERPERNPAFHTQRGSGNTNDLRGKVLRITPLADGGYTVPDGNLFAPGSDEARPEIHAMAVRRDSTRH